MQFLVFDSLTGTPRRRPVLRWGDVPDAMIAAQATAEGEVAVPYQGTIPDWEPDEDGIDHRQLTVDPRSLRLHVQSLGRLTRDFAAARRARLAVNIALRATDWTQLSDAPLNASQRAAWTAYRSALRALPDHPDFPANIEWPKAPGPIEEITP